MGVKIQQKDKEASKLYHSQTCTQVGIWVSIFGFGLMAPSIILLIETMMDHYDIHEILQFYPDLDTKEQLIFNETYTYRWYYFAIIGIIIGAVQFFTSALLSKWLEDWVKFWGGVHFLVFLTALISLPVGFYLKVYISRVGTVMLCVLGFDLFFIILGFMLIKATSDMVKNTTDL